MRSSAWETTIHTFAVSLRLLSDIFVRLFSSSPSNIINIDYVGKGKTFQCLTSGVSTRAKTNAPKASLTL